MVSERIILLLERCILQPVHWQQVVFQESLQEAVKKGLVRRYKEYFFKITPKGKRYLIGNFDELLKDGVPASVIRELFKSLDTAHLVRFLVHDNEFVRKFAAQCIPLDEN